MSFVFISYSRANRDLVSRVVRGLQSSGWKTWYDTDLEPGNPSSFSKELEERIRECSAVVCCWSQQSVHSLYVRAEAHRALDTDKLVPLRLDKTSLPLPFNALHTSDLSDWEGGLAEECWTSLVNAIHRKICTSRANRSPTEVATASFLESVARLAGPLSARLGSPDPASRNALFQFDRTRYSVSALLAVAKSLIPTIPDSSEPWWYEALTGENHKHEALALHASYHLRELVKLAKGIEERAAASLKVIENVEKQVYSKSSDA